MIHHQFNLPTGSLHSESRPLYNEKSHNPNLLGSITCRIYGDFHSMWPEDPPFPPFLFPGAFYPKSPFSGHTERESRHNQPQSEEAISFQERESVLREQHISCFCVVLPLLSSAQPQYCVNRSCASQQATDLLLLSQECDRPVVLRRGF